MRINRTAVCLSVAIVVLAGAYGFTAQPAEPPGQSPCSAGLSVTPVPDPACSDANGEPVRELAVTGRCAEMEPDVANAADGIPELCTEDEPMVANAAGSGDPSKRLCIDVFACNAACCAPPGQIKKWRACCFANGACDSCPVCTQLYCR